MEWNLLLVTVFLFLGKTQPMSTIGPIECIATKHASFGWA